MGHEGENKSQGITTYLKRIGIQNLKKVIEGVEYPAGINLPLGSSTTSSGQMTGEAFTPQ